jgi:hypothetical protein
MIATVRTKVAPHDALFSSRKLILLESVVWSSPKKSLAAIDPLSRHRQYGNDVGNHPNAIDFSKVVRNPKAVPPKVHWQNTDRPGQAEKTTKTRRRFRYRCKQHLSQSQAVKPANQAKISHLRDRMMILNPAFANGFILELTIGLTRIRLIWLKMRCKLPHKVVQNLSINRNKRVIRR